MPYTSQTLHSFFPHLAWVQRELQARRGGGGEEEGNLSPRGLKGTSSGRLLRRLSSFLPPWVSDGLKRSRRERAAGELNNRRRPRRGDECTQAKWPHSRTSGPPSRPSVYLFTFPGSSNTSAFSEFRNMGAALVLPASQLFIFPTPPLYASCWRRGEV